jgi:hypothetical protein
MASILGREPSAGYLPFRDATGLAKFPPLIPEIRLSDWESQ